MEFKNNSQMYKEQIIYIHYKKIKIFLYLLLYLFLSTGFAVFLYNDIFYEKLVYQIVRGAEVTKYVYMPFSFPGSLWRINFWGLLGFLTMFLVACAYLKELFVKNPKLIISRYGIMYESCEILPWFKVKSLIREKQVLSNGKQIEYIIIELMDPVNYFGKYKSFFGKRRIIIDISLVEAALAEGFLINNIMVKKLPKFDI